MGRTGRGGPLQQRSGGPRAHPGGEVAVAARHGDVLGDLDGLNSYHLAALVHLLQQLVQPGGAAGPITVCVYVVACMLHT